MQYEVYSQVLKSKICSRYNYGHTIHIQFSRITSSLTHEMLDLTHLTQCDRGTQQFYAVWPYHRESDLMLLVCALGLKCLADAVGGKIIQTAETVDYNIQIY